MIDLKKTISLKREPLSVPEWTPDPLFVQEMTGRQLETMRKYVSVKNGVTVTEHQIAQMIILSVTDAEGKYVFTEKDIEDLESQPMGLLTKVIETVGKVTGNEQALEEVKKSLKNQPRKNSSIPS
jgi:uncharacterized membrane protein YjjP (DUF1212 family)